MTPLVSIIIVSWNGRADLARCLCSLQAQRYPTAELIIVDNASEDNSADYVATRYPDSHLIRNKRNIGFAAAVNQGAAAAHGTILVCLNPDTVVHPDWLSPLIAAVQTHNVGLATSRILMLSKPESVNSCGNESSLTGLTVCIGAGEAARQHAASGPVPSVSGAAFAIRRDCFVALGGFDAKYFAYFEDTDLSWRARLAGYDIVLAAESRVYHDYRFQMYPQKLYWLERNRYVTLLTCLRPATLIRLLPTLIIGELVAWGFALLKGPTMLLAKVRAWRWIFQNRSHLHQRRRMVSDQSSDAVIVRDMTTTLRFDYALPNTIGRLLNTISEPLFKLNKRFALAS